jgi:hypothetical protein
VAGLGAWILLKLVMDIVITQGIVWGVVYARAQKIVKSLSDPQPKWPNTLHRVVGLLLGGIIEGCLWPNGP